MDSDFKRIRLRVIMEARIIHIDNDQHIRDLLTSDSKQEGWHFFSYPFAAINGAEIQQIHPDLIILNLDPLDGGSSWAFLQLLKTEAATAKIPVLVSTDSSQLPADIQDYLLTRFIKVVRKPFDLANLATLIQETISSANQAGEIFSSQKRLPILLVEDQEDLRETFTAILELEGYQVVTANNGKVALNTLSQTDCCIILLDIDMPIMNGYQFLSAYERQLRPHTPVIIMTGGEKIDTPVVPSFVVNKLIKPIQIDSFLELVEKYVLRA